MPTPSAIYRAACSAAIVEHNRAMAGLSACGLTPEAQACGRRDVQDAYISASIAALAAYNEAQQLD